MKLLVFDLDGTLADTSVNISNAVNTTLQHLNLPSLEQNIIISFVGDGAQKLMERCLNYLACYTQQLYKQAIDILYDYYHDNICTDTRLYDGVWQTLQHLPHTKAILTNKPDHMTQVLVPFLRIDPYFVEIIGASNAEYLKPSPFHLQRLMTAYGSIPETTYMIGDSLVDIQTAKNAGTKSIAVTYGFGKAQQLQVADITIDQFSKLLEIFSDNRQ